VVLDDVLNAEVIPLSALLHPSLEPSDVGNLSLLSPVWLSHSLLFDNLVDSDHSLGRPTLHSVGVVELDVGDLLSGGPLLVVGNPLDESSVLGVLVLVDVLDASLVDVLVLVDSSEVSNSDSPALQRPSTSVTDDSLSLDHLVELGVSDSLLDDSVDLSTSDDSVTLSDSHILGLLVDDSSDLNQSDSSGLALDDGSGVLNSVSSPLSALGNSSNNLISVTGLVGVSVSLNDLPFLLASDSSHLADASPLLSVDSLDAQFSLDDLDSSSGSVGCLDLDSLGNFNNSWLGPALGDDLRSVDLDLSLESSLLSLVSVDNDNSVNLLVDGNLLDSAWSLADDLLLSLDVSLLDEGHLLGSLGRELVVKLELDSSLLLLSAGLNSLGDDLVVSLDNLLVLRDNISVELSLVDLASEGLLVVDSRAGVAVASITAPLVGGTAGARPGSSVTSSDSLMRMAGMPGSAA
jgi:hypothetical protein